MGSGLDVTPMLIPQIACQLQFLSGREQLVLPSDSVHLLDPNNLLPLVCAPPNGIPTSRLGDAPSVVFSSIFTR